MPPGLGNCKRFCESFQAWLIIEVGQFSILLWTGSQESATGEGGSSLPSPPAQLQSQLEGQDGAGERQGWRQRSTRFAGREPGLKPKFDTAELEKVAEQLDQEILPIYFCLLERSCIKQSFLLPP